MRRVRSNSRCASHWQRTNPGCGTLGRVGKLEENTLSAFLIVRAEVAAEADRGPFDQWYRDEHLPDAKREFSAVSASRGWSDVDPSVHLAFYEFATLEEARALASSPTIAGFIKEFDRVWGERVVRSREVVEIIQQIRG